MSASNDLAAVRQIKRAAEAHLAGKANTVAVGVGYKISNGVVTNELAVMVSVRRKLPLAELTEAQAVPRSVDGVRTDVVETGEIVAFQDPKAKMRPARPGVSIGHFQITAGTFGCLVRKGGELFILSNNHVLANSNNAQVGDPVWQPGRADGGTSADQIGALAEFVPIAFDGSTPAPGNGCSPLSSLLSAFAPKPKVQNVPGDNKVDCALARPTTPDLVNADILNIGVPAGTAAATLGTALQKSGRNTGYTTGTVTQIDVRVNVNDGGPTATFSGQLMAGAMSQGGDSGSAVLDMQKRVVALLYAGSATTTIMNPIQYVVDALGIEVVTQ
ncbi:MAG: hypothetical protein JNK29_12400 [Anaerolineales bacterium]|nr:hypothetical protein [Anaerolineales bacterium]